MCWTQACTFLAGACFSGVNRLGLFLSAVLKSEMLRMGWTRSYCEMIEKKKEKKKKKIGCDGIACPVSVTPFLAGAVRREQLRCHRAGSRRLFCPDLSKNESLILPSAFSRHSPSGYLKFAKCKASPATVRTSAVSAQPAFGPRKSCLKSPRCPGWRGVAGARAFVEHLLPSIKGEAQVFCHLNVSALLEKRRKLFFLLPGKPLMSEGDSCTSLHPRITLVCVSVVLQRG